MRILFLTNFYPPHELGGQERSCQDVVEGLRERGHETVVLTSMFGTNNIPRQKDGVYRQLYLEMDLGSLWNSYNFFFKRKTREEHNLKCFRQLLAQFDPDIVFVWGMWNLQRSLAATAESICPEKVVYRFGDYWPTLPSQHVEYWHTPSRKWFTDLLKSVLRPVALSLIERDGQLSELRFEKAICISKTSRKELVDAGIPVSSARVIYNGIDAERFLNQPKNSTHNNEGNIFRLVLVSRIVPEKGIETAVQALEVLRADTNIDGKINLTIAGSGKVEFEEHLRGLVVRAGLNELVSFKGQIPYEEIPSFLRRFDALIFPSIWVEPFGRVILESMVSGLVVIATSRGGPSEVITHGENGLLFEPSDPEGLAEEIRYLMEDKVLRNNLVCAGRKTVLEKFTQDRMLGDIEAYLYEVASSQ